MFTLNGIFLEVKEFCYGTHLLYLCIYLLYLYEYE